MSIEVTERAVEEIRQAAAKRPSPPKGLRVGIRGGGCTGFSYLFEWSDTEARTEDKVLEFAGGQVKVFIDPKSYIFLVIEKLREVTGLGLSRSENVMDSTSNNDAFVEVSAILKANAVNLIKISSDLRLLNLLGEIKLPSVQAGSSIMPGKVNPVIAEAVAQAGYRVMANDTIASEVCARGTLQINEFMPLLAHAMLETTGLLIASGKMFAAHVEGITADENKCREYFEKSPALVTAFLPHIGYDRASALLAGFKKTNDPNLRKFLEGKLGKDLVDKVLSPYSLVSLGYRDENADHT